MATLEGMSKPDTVRRRPGRPPDPDTPRQTLGSVRVTDAQLAAYASAAATTGRARAAWVRDTLDRAAARVRRR